MITLMSPRLPPPFLNDTFVANLNSPRELSPVLPLVPSNDSSPLPAEEFCNIEIEKLLEFSHLKENSNIHGETLIVAPRQQHGLNSKSLPTEMSVNNHDKIEEICSRLQAPILTKKHNSNGHRLIVSHQMNMYNQNFQYKGQINY